ncbi:MAG: RES family NAD+ phosphorylase [Cytophagales bacterium]|nr:RES family NAD+ phosphorylase [Cytophagales bacterium]
MLVYRLSLDEYAHDLSGLGAEMYGGRWNNKGMPAVYTSEHRSLCVLETLANVIQFGNKKQFCMTEISIPDELTIKTYAAQLLPKGWNGEEYRFVSAGLGTEWLSGMGSAVLKVPSVLIHEEYNYIINPRHSDAKHIKICMVYNYHIQNRLL